MQWLALANWILVAMLALGAAAVPLPSLGGQALCALMGVGTMVVFSAGGGHGWAWASFGCACAGTLFAIGGARTLVEGSSAVMQGTPVARRELVAGMEGAELPFMAAAIVLSLSVALI